MTQDPNPVSKGDTGPLVLPEDLQESPPSAKPPIWMWVLAALGALLVLGALVFLFSFLNRQNNTSPIAVVEGFVKAVEERNASAMLSFMVPTEQKREIGPEIRAYLSYIERIQFQNSQYSLLDNNGQVAHVRWTADMQYELNLGDEQRSGTNAVDMTFELVFFEGSWYLQRIQLPNT
jgi:uncharacterized membrane protein YvbJ